MWTEPYLAKVDKFIICHFCLFLHWQQQQQPSWRRRRHLLSKYELDVLNTPFIKMGSNKERNCCRWLFCWNFTGEKETLSWKKFLCWTFVKARVYLARKSTGFPFESSWGSIVCQDLCRSYNYTYNKKHSRNNYCEWQGLILISVIPSEWKRGIRTHFSYLLNTVDLLIKSRSRTEEASFKGCSCKTAWPFLKQNIIFN